MLPRKGGHLNTSYAISSVAIVSFFCGTTWALDRYVDDDPPATDAANNCMVMATPCLTLQHAINQSAVNDTIHVAAGTYSVAGLITINKTLTILGAQAGVDARTRAGAESILDNTQGISLGASNSVIDGFTIQGSIVSAFTGYGLWINPGMMGNTIINNIFQNNIVGLAISNSGANQLLVQHNLFRTNNVSPGGAFGTGLYTDEFVSGVLSNVLINENHFEDNDNGGIGFSSLTLAFPASNITITNNTINNCGRGMYFFNTHNAIITGNTITNLTAPTDTGGSVAIAIFGANENFTIERNHLQNGVRYGIRIAEFFGGLPEPPNTNIAIHLNGITGYALSGMRVDNQPIGPVDFATCTWWGSDTGPTNPLNPGGTGDVVDGPGGTNTNILLANFDPWLLGLDPDSPCGAQPFVTKAFDPASICEKGTSALTLTLNNPTSIIATLEAPFIDLLPVGLRIQGNDTSNTCGGVVTAINNGTSVTLTGGSIPANDSCSVTVNVTSKVANSYTNTVIAGSLQTDRGTNTEDAKALLNVRKCTDEDDDGHGHVIPVPVPAPSLPVLAGPTPNAPTIVSPTPVIGRQNIVPSVVRAEIAPRNLDVVSDNKLAQKSDGSQKRGSGCTTTSPGPSLFSMAAIILWCFGSAVAKRRRAT